MKDRTTKEKLFFSVRFFLVVFCFVSSLVVAQPVPENNLPNPLIFFGIVPIMMLIVIGIQYINPSSAKPWQSPSWWVNPFNFSQPYQFFHMAFYAFIACGVGVLFSTLYASSSVKYGLCLLSIGASGLISIKLSQLRSRGSDPSFL